MKIIAALDYFHPPKLHLPFPQLETLKSTTLTPSATPPPSPVDHQVPWILSIFLDSRGQVLPISQLGHCRICIWSPGSCSVFARLSRRRAFLGGLVVKNPAADAKDPGLIPGSGRFTGGRNGNPLQYSCQDSCMDRERGEVWAAGHLAPG